MWANPLPVLSLLYIINLTLQSYDLSFSKCLFVRCYIRPDSADAFLLNCTDVKDGCYVAAQQVLGKSGATIVVDNPKEGNWRIVVRTRDRVDKAVTYSVREASLTPSATPIEAADAKHASGTTWSVALPAKQIDAQYVAFHIAGDLKKEVRQDAGAKNGVSIALTALDTNAP